jgi:hypothetical protein
MLWLNGFLNKPSSKYDVKELDKKYGLSLTDTSISASKQVIFARNYDVIANKRLSQISDKNISDMFGFFSEFDKHDCVVVYGKVGIDSIEMTCGEHLEIEYVIKSLKRYCSSWVGRIFVVGSKPPIEIQNDVIHIYCDNPYTHCKDANIIHKIRFACENIKDLTDDFLMISDDQIVTKESSWEDMKPRIVRRFNDWSVDKWEKNRKIDFWHECLYNTLNLFEKDKCCFWEPHIWSPINKHKFLKMCDKYDYVHGTDCIILSLYYNFIEQDIVNRFDSIHIQNSRAKRRVNTLTLKDIPRHLSWADSAFSEKKFRDILDIIVGFNNCENNNISEGVVVQKIREEIKKGNIVKEISPDGTYIWRKVRK